MEINNIFSIAEYATYYMRQIAHSAPLRAPKTAKKVLHCLKVKQHDIRVKYGIERKVKDVNGFSE